MVASIRSWLPASFGLLPTHLPAAPPTFQVYFTPARVFLKYVLMLFQVYFTPARVFLKCVLMLFQVYFIPAQFFLKYVPMLAKLEAASLVPLGALLLLQRYAIGWFFNVTLFEIVASNLFGVWHINLFPTCSPHGVLGLATSRSGIHFMVLGSVVHVIVCYVFIVTGGGCIYECYTCIEFQMKWLYWWCWDLCSSYLYMLHA